jgi:hypothetical protein
MSDIDDLLRVDGRRWRQEHGVDGEAAMPIDLPWQTAQKTTTRRSGRYRLVLTCVLAAMAVALVAFLITATGSGDNHRNSVAGLPTAPASTDSLVPAHLSVPIDISKLPRGQQLGTNVHGRLLSMPWELLGVRDGGRTLVIFYASGDGYDIKNIGFRVLETTTSVELIAISRDTKTGGEEPGNYATGAARILLSRPLGQRALLHPPTAWSADYLHQQ